jgi:hypothetical protein
VSRIAAKVLRMMRDDSLTFHVGSEKLTCREIRALAASCLSQDEQKGKRGRKVGR